MKTERAEHHVAHLKEIFARHLRESRNALVPKRNRNRRERTTIGKPLPRHTPTVLGDALHNLRASLDHAYCILVEANGGTVNQYVKFPFSEKGSRQDLEGSVNGHAKAGFAPSAKIIRLIFDEIQPFVGGKGQDLLDLHLLDIADKHMILLPTQQMTRIDHISFENGPTISGLTIITSGLGTAISGGGLKHNANQQVSFEICFGVGQPFEGKPILPTLAEILARVVGTLQDLERVAGMID